LEIEPDYVEAHNNLGTILVGNGRVDEAIVHYRKVLEIKPDHVEAHNNLGVVLAGNGRVDEAIVHYQKALAIKPDYAEAHNNLGMALGSSGRVDEAIVHYQTALELKADYASARTNLDIARSQREQMVKTLADRRESLRSRPDDVVLLNDTAWMLATNPNASVRNGPEAVGLAQRALELSGQREPAILGTLAAAYAEAGRLSEALQTARKAVELATQQGNQPLAESIKARIPLYEARTPFREIPPPSTVGSAQP
jgi:protein O-mannosyl-transferase